MSDRYVFRVRLDLGYDREAQRTKYDERYIVAENYCAALGLVAGGLSGGHIPDTAEDITITRRERLGIDASSDV